MEYWDMKVYQVTSAEFQGVVEQFNYLSLYKPETIKYRYYGYWETKFSSKSYRPRFTRLCVML